MTTRCEIQCEYWL